jgi:hypothetical protein
LRNRRRRTVVGGTVLSLALGGLVAALPAQASTGPSATAAPSGIKAATGAGISSPAAVLTTKPLPYISTPVVTDSLNPGGVTAADAMLICATSQIPFTYQSGNEIVLSDSLAIPVGCLSMYNGEWFKVGWTGHSRYMEVTMQTDGNLVLALSDGGTPTTAWSSGTTFAGNSQGPGCFMQFQSNAELVVRNCASTAIWATGAHTDPDAVLVFRYDGDLLIEDSSSEAATVLWSTNTTA